MSTDKITKNKKIQQFSMRIVCNFLTLLLVIFAALTYIESHFDKKK